MRLLAFDGRMGASGDMLLGALLAAGADADALAPVEAALDVEYRITETQKAGIAATAVDVVLASAPRSTDTDGDAGGHEHAHEQHDDDHAHGAPAEHGGPTRTYREVIDIVDEMSLPVGVAATAESTFTILGRAEAAVHGTDLETTRFHEVGADDAIADVVGVALLLEDLDPDRVVTTPLAAGGGHVHMTHGEYPVPPPAVTEIAARADWEFTGGPVESELLTPTGAAILAEIAEGVSALPQMAVSSVGYGAGTKEFASHPNVLRALTGRTRGGLTADDIVVLETNVDDASPEVLGDLQETLVDAGARDVSVVPVTMKKSRPGHLVKVVAKPADADRLARRLAEETGTLGVRQTVATHRLIAERRFVTTTVAIDDERYEVAVKIARTSGGPPFDVSAEYDDAAAVARETDLPVREVLRRAEEAARSGGALADVLLHVVEAERWQAADDDRAYHPPSLDTDGFVHLAPPARVPGVAQYTFPDADDLLVLVIDPDALDAPLKFEETPTGAFPHLYGPLPPAAIIAVHSLAREDGRYVLPPDIDDS